MWVELVFLLHRMSLISLAAIAQIRFVKLYVIIVVYSTARCAVTHSEINIKHSDCKFQVWNYDANRGKLRVIYRVIFPLTLMCALTKVLHNNLIKYILYEKLDVFLYRVHLRSTRASLCPGTNVFYSTAVKTFLYEKM